MSGVKPVRAVIFDLYRTLIDIWTDERNPEVWARLARFLTYQGVWIAPEELSALFSGGAEQQQRDRPGAFPEVDVDLVFRDILTHAGCREADSLAGPLTAFFRTLSMVQFRLFPDVLPSLTRLRENGHRIGIVSDAQRAFFRTELVAAGLVPFVDVAVASGEHGFHKPDPRLFHIALAELGISAEEAVYVGDSPDRDMCGAQDAGLTPLLLDRSSGRVGVLRMPAGSDPAHSAS
jgi:putative hydrolase of the HAD superfamily